MEIQVFKTYRARRVDNNNLVKGSLLYDRDQDCWRIVRSFFDVPKPKTENQFGVDAPEIRIKTLEIINPQKA